MPRIDPLPLESLPAEFQERMKTGEERMGFRANDGLTLARVPGLMEGLSAMTWAIYGKDGLVTNEIKRLVSIVTSSAAGCTYCQSHTVHGADMAGIDAEKIKAIWEYETSPLFSDAERAAMRVAQGAGHAPVECTDADFDELKKYFDDNQICEIVSIIALFGFLNKWNATLATDIEANPLAALQKLGPDANAA
ncbi:MAG: carboxymuconolactone decarboxylase family protein [Alphaproteobacteria bacterium]|nr:carboxymuconolactone decarboxylase family protein [Alphaproteobacteria bacterium]